LFSQAGALVHYLPCISATGIKKIGSGDGLIILHRHPWGGRFQMLVVEERQVIGGNGREPSGQEGWISSE